MVPSRFDVNFDYLNVKGSALPVNSLKEMNPDIVPLSGIHVQLVDTPMATHPSGYNKDLVMV